MGKFTGKKKLEEMKLMARGNVRKIAEYEQARKAYDDMVRTIFDDETPFVDCPSEGYVKQLKAAAEADDADDVAKLRYEVIKERADYWEYSRRQKLFDLRETKKELEQKIEVGQLSKADLYEAEKYARTFPAPQNIAMYVKIKRILGED